MIYTKDNIGTNNAYSSINVQLEQAYDKTGIPLLDTSSILKVMSYNVQDFKGINNQEDMQVGIINTYQPDIVGVQEFYTNNTVPAIAGAMFSGYNLIRFNHKNYTAIASKTELTGRVVADYAVQDPTDVEQRNETRGYIKAYTQFNGHTICLFNTHLCLANAYKFQQMQELLDLVLAEDSEYIIVTGDFNVYCMSSDMPEYESTWKLWKDNGFNLANGTDEVGFTGTYSNDTTASAVFTTAPDNIITSSNITINSVVYDKTKLSNLTGDKIDHIPMISYLTLN